MRRHKPFRLLILSSVGSAIVMLTSAFSPVAAQSAGSSTGGESVASRRIELGSARPASQRTSSSNRPVSVQQSESGQASGGKLTTKPVQRVAIAKPPQPPANSPQVGRQRSVVARAAHGEIITEPLPEMLYQGQFAGVGSGGHYEPGCGVEGCTSCCDAGPFIGGPSMGMGPGCGIEPACGIEPGCGVEACGTCGPMFGAPLSCDSMACGPVGCDSMACGPWFNECYPIFLPIKRINWSNFEFFAGTQAFSGPPNFAGVNGGAATAREGSASFGVHEGFNFSRRSFLFGGGISAQFGLRGVHTNGTGAEFTDEKRNQLFLTGGFFRRVDYGFQGGVVVDYLNDDWYYDLDMTQIRAHLGWKHDPCNEFGYQYFGSLGGDTSPGVINVGGVATPVNVAFDSADQHRIFFRRNFRRGGTGELFAGATGSSDGLLGALLDIPLLDGLSMRTGVTYVNAQVDAGEIDHQEDSWHLSWAFVWYPCGSSARSPYDRPMFDVADNGTFIVGRE